MFSDVNLHMEPGECVGIMCDEVNTTTLLGLLATGQLKPNEGRVLVDGLDLAHHDCNNMRGLIEFMPQKGVLFMGTILQNLTMYEDSLVPAAMDAAALVGLDTLVANLPQGYETPIGSHHGTFLPGALVQRIAVARAIIHRPRIIIFDRANSTLDSGSDLEMRSLISRLKGISTIMLITNQPGWLTMVDIIYEVVGDTLEELF